ncbi:MAG TPA: acyltransferase [Patescibacteria group bacterium]
MNIIKQFFYKSFPGVYKLLSGNAIYSYKFKNLPIDSYLHPVHKISNSQWVLIGEGVTIEKDVWINIIKEKDKHGNLKIGKGVKIGQRCTLSCANSIDIDDNALIGLNVYIADHEHSYQNVRKSIMHQGIVGSKEIYIKKNAWIGNNVIILGQKKIIIGKNSVIGANSVVKSSIPDFCVAVGNPAKVIKRYNFSKKKWLKVKK